MKKKLAATPAPAAAFHSLTRPDIYADRLSKLSPEERAKIREMVTDALFVKFLRIVAVFKPSSNCANCGSTTRDAFSDARANARLGEIRGWEFYEGAMFLALNEPPQVKQAAKETFPEEGRVDADWNPPNGTSQTNGAPKKAKAGAR